jgi:RHS repeat-associated protein
VLREQKTPEELTYRYKYQGQYAEKDEETGWEHFELREFDPIIGRWTSKDPKGEFYSPYVGMGNNPISNNDPDGGTTRPPIANGILVPDNFFKRAYNFLFGYQFLNDAYKFGKSHPDEEYFIVRMIEVITRGQVPVEDFGNLEALIGGCNYQVKVI